MESRYFPDVEPIHYEGPDTTNPLAFIRESATCTDRQSAPIRSAIRLAVLGASLSASRMARLM